MDEAGKFWKYADMTLIPTWHLYGETHAFPDLLHIEKISDRAAGLDWSIAPHRHLHLHQVFLLLSGTIRLSLDGIAQAILPPMAINIPRGIVHGFVFSADTEGFVLTLPASEFPDLFGPMSETASALAQAFTLPAQGLHTCFVAVSDLYTSQQPFRRTAMKAQTTSLVAAMLLMGPENHRPGACDQRIKGFEEAIHASIQEHRSIEAYARDLALSARHLNRLCKKETGLSAQSFVEALKMREACSLLVYTRMTAQQVAYHLGYDDASYFGRVFQRNLRLSPGAYRKMFDT